MNTELIKQQAKSAVSELLSVAGLHKGDILVVGCSSSEIVGETIGHGSSLEAAEAVFEAIYPILKEKGGYIFSSDHSIPNNVSFDTMRRIVERVKEVGKY